MAWQNPVWYGFDKATVNGRAPNISGVYALKGPDGRWLYVGETASIASSLLGHLGGDNKCITDCGPAAFSFESRAADERAARRDALFREHLPLCNQGPA
jgi:hypothetical protein